MTTKLPFTELALRRAIRAARKEGVRVTGITITGDGTITLYETDGGPVIALEPGAVHRALSSEFEDFKA